MVAEQNTKTHQKMTEGPLAPFLFEMALPSVIAMLVVALYSLADSFFVSALGTEASAAVGVCFSIQAAVQAIAYTLGVGAGSLLSRKLGERKPREASLFASVAFFGSLVSGLLIGASGLIWSRELVIFLGAKDGVIELSLSYARYLLLAAPFMCATFVLSQLLRAEGLATYSMVGLLIGSALNIALDPILITRMGMGISGASLATWISQTVSFFILLSAYLLKKSELKLFSLLSSHMGIPLGRVIHAGLPSFARQGLIALSTILLNHAAAAWGDAAVSAISIVNRLFLLAFSVCLGIGQGMMPVTGYNYGSGKTKRVQMAYRYALLSAVGLMLVIELLYLAIPTQLIALFRKDAEVIAIGTKALRAQSAVLVLHALITCTNMLLQSIGKQVGATVMACGRQGIFFVPLLYLLPSFFGIESIIYIQPVADMLTFLLSVPFCIFAFRMLKEKNRAV